MLTKYIHHYLICVVGFETYITLTTLYKFGIIAFISYIKNIVKHMNILL